MSIKTANEYLAAVRALARWLVDNKRMAADPFDGLAGGNPELDRRRERRFLSADEVGRLIGAAARSGWRFRGLTGPDRAILYALAVYTGYRATELAALSPECFRLDGPTPSASLPAALARTARGRCRHSRWIWRTPSGHTCTTGRSGNQSGRGTGRTMRPT